MNTIYALGFFDGVHVGHRALLRKCRELAAENGCAAGAVTFGSHPDTLVLGSTPVLINTPEDRERLLRQDMDCVITLPFDRKMCETPWDAFLDLLCRDYGAAGFVCGDDFRFGARGAGNGILLTEYCQERGLPCAVVPEQTVDGTRVSSTHIRTLLESGRMEEVNRFLGHPHILTGRVIPGKQLGRTLGIPTANLRFPDGLAIPRFGVYACLVELDGRSYPAVTNIGTRPTVAGQGIIVEPWILDFSGNLYDREITLEFHKFVRPERKFPSLDALQSEIRANAEETRAILKDYAATCHYRENAV